MAIQNLRSSSAHKRPIPNVLSAGQIAVNTNQASPGLFFKDSNGDLVKVGPVHIGTAAPNSSPATTAADALVSGTVYQILTLGNTDFTAVGASANTVGVVFTATGAGTGTGTVSGQQGNEKGEQWLDTTGGAYDLKIYDGSAWRSQAGEFVNVTGDTMTGALGVVAGSASAPGVFFSGDTDTGLMSAGLNNLSLVTAGSQRIVVDNNGNVGLNYTAPSVLEDAADNLVIYDATESGMTFLAGTTGYGSIYFADGTTGAAMSRGQIQYNHSDDSLQISTSSSEALKIDSSGRLLVGTSTGDGSINKFQVTGNTAGNTGGNISLSRGAIPTAVNQTLGFISFGDGGGDIYAQVKSQCDGAAAAGDAPGRLVFLTTADGASSPTERMRIESDGDIRLGGSSDYAWIRPYESSTGNLLIASNKGATGGANDSAIVFQPRGTERMRVDSAGNVGIGTSSPNELLTLQDGNVNNVSGSILQMNLGPNGYWQIEAANGTTSSQRALRFINNNGSASSTLATILQNGNMGLGTSSPDYNLTVANTSSYVIQNLKSSTTEFCGIYFGDTDGAGRGTIVYDNSTDAFTFRTNGSGEDVRIDSAGNVGIGATSVPTNFRVEIAEPGSVGLNLRNTNNSANDSGRIAFSQGSGNLASTNTFVDIIATADTVSPLRGNLKFRTNQGNNLTEQMRIDASGRLLVGLSSGGGESNLIVGGDINGASNMPSIALRRGISTPSNGNSIGEVNFETQGGYHIAAIRADADGNHSAGSSHPGRLVFSVTTDGASSPDERMRIANTGTCAHFATNDTVLGANSSAASGNTVRLFSGSYNATAVFSGVESFRIWSSGDVNNQNNSYTGISDVKLKENIADASSQWNDIKSIRVRNYNLKEGSTHRQIGVIAQEIETTCPGLVDELPDLDGLTTTKSVKYSVLYMKAVKALQEAMERIETLEQRLSDAGIA
nr:endosialidase [uncultured Mediterranean phage uvMED]BAR39260.1 endosialidase [uncultured Mediterranean phage uvMED]